jgi:hypothetical protein
MVRVRRSARIHMNEILTLQRASDARWTVVRVPRLTDDAHTGEFRHGSEVSLGMRDTAARANVADFILPQRGNPALQGEEEARSLDCSTALDSGANLLAGSLCL